MIEIKQLELITNIVEIINKTFNIDIQGIDIIEAPDIGDENRIYVRFGYTIIFRDKDNKGHPTACSSTFYLPHIGENWPNTSIKIKSKILNNTNSSHCCDIYDPEIGTSATPLHAGCNIEQLDNRCVPVILEISTKRCANIRISQKHIGMDFYGKYGDWPEDLNEIQLKFATMRFYPHIERTNKND